MHMFHIHLVCLGPEYTLYTLGADPDKKMDPGHQGCFLTFSLISQRMLMDLHEGLSGLSTWFVTMSKCNLMWILDLMSVDYS